jgi:hypothetical protein
MHVPKWLGRKVRTEGWGSGLCKAPGALKLFPTGVVLAAAAPDVNQDVSIVFMHVWIFICKYTCARACATSAVLE